MSVYTTVSEQEFSHLLSTYNLGTFEKAEGITAGIENTNYFLDTSVGNYVFTIFESINISTLKFYVSLLQEIASSGLPCPVPQHDKNNIVINFINKKPFIIVNRLKGKNIKKVSLEQCKQLALALAKLHKIKFTNQTQMENRRGQAWRLKTFQQISDKLNPEDKTLIQSELNTYENAFFEHLPVGLIHSDLFKDNVLFENNQLTAIIDFYDACHDYLLYDVAITVNEWCTNDNGLLDEAYLATFITQYESLRPLSLDEKRAWPTMLRMAAMRFWLSRLYDSLNQKQGDLTQQKNPDEYRNILIAHLENPDSRIT